MKNAVDDALAPLLARISSMTRVAVHLSGGTLVLTPRNFREACEAQAVRARLEAEDAEVRLSLAHVRQIAEPNQRACTVRVGAGAPLDEVETFLKGWSLTLGWLSPGARTLTVGEFLQGRYAGLRVIPGNRLETAALSVSVALAGGGGWEGTRAPRSAAGPELSAMFVGAGTEAGLVVEAVLRALPRFELRERLHADLPGPEPLVRLLRKALQRDVPLAEVHSAPRAEGLAVTFAIAGPAFRIRRDRHALEELLRTEGQLQTVRSVAEEPPHTNEVELGWEELAGAADWRRPVSLYRLARESVIAASSAAISGGVRLDGEPEPLPRALIERLQTSGRERTATR